MRLSARKRMQCRSECLAERPIRQNDCLSEAPHRVLTGRWPVRLYVGNDVASNWCDTGIQNLVTVRLQRI